MGKAAALFYSNANQTLHARVTPTTEQREFLQAQWNQLAEYLKSTLRERHGFSISTWIQGSYKYGTLIRPILHGDDFDVDVGVYFEWDNTRKDVPSPLELRQWVQEALFQYRDSIAGPVEVSHPPKERCSRVVYPGRFHIDTPVYHLWLAKDRRRLARLNGEWEESDPKAIYKWFQKTSYGIVDTFQRDQVRRVIRYLKAWTTLAFRLAPKSRPSSILLTVLVNEELKAEYNERWKDIDDEVALTAAIRRIHVRLLKNSTVPNPVAKTENLNRISPADWDGFLVRLQALRDTADRAQSASSETAAALIWSEAFSFLMPLPDIEEIQVVDGASKLPLMLVPDVAIRVSRSPRDRQVSEHTNAAHNVPLDHRIEFSLVDAMILPEGSTIEWTLRYCGADPNISEGLGRRQVGIGVFSVTESANREGVFSMDCVIRVNGSVYAARRVPFDVGQHIRSPAAASKLPPRVARITRASLA